MLCCLAWCWGGGQRQGSGNHVEFCCWVVGLFGVRGRMRIGEGSGWMDGMGCMGTTWAHEVLASTTNPHRAGHPLATFFLVYFFSRLLFPTFSALRGHPVLTLISLCLSVFLSLVSVASLLWLLALFFLLYVCVCLSGLLGLELGFCHLVLFLLIHSAQTLNTRCLSLSFVKMDGEDKKA